MTKKDYELIALGLSYAEPSNINPRGYENSTGYTLGKRHAWKNTCNTLADRLTLDNPRFDKQRFLQACGIEAK